MWNTIDAIVKINPTGRRKSGMNTFTALVLGAGVGIVAWQAIRSNRSGR